ncbi:helix-turn-helix transcriptional regulator [Nonomuraea sp. NPDC049419]|uniref:helix-turn-helix domain-containing protein n=1 Tax=Nonomuraea sp. NPDC049419 TaxID=3155772 RepID=UPI00342CEB57
MTGTDDGQVLAARLRMLKERSGASFEQLSRQSGVSRSSLHRYCSGTKVPASYGPVHAFARACGATGEELRELHRLWALADAGRPGPEIHEDAEETTEAPRSRRRVKVAVVATIVAAVAGVSAFALMRADAGQEPPSIVESRPGTVPTAVVRVHNVEGDCKSKAERVPACSMGLARDPRREYAAGNVVDHRVWHGDVLRTDCILYDGDRVEDEMGVGTTRWFRVLLDDVPGGQAWLPAVRTQDHPNLPTCG